MSIAQLAEWCVYVPLIGAFFIAITGKNPNLREGVTITTAIVLFLMVCTIAQNVWEGGRPEVLFAEPFPGIEIALSIEPLGMLFALIASFLWIITSIYAIGYMRGHHEKNQTRFYICFAIAISGVMGVAFAGNLFTLFVFYEMLTISTYPLVTHAGTEKAKQGGRIYLGILISTSILFLLFALIWTWQLAGTTDFKPGGILVGTASAETLGLLLLLFIFGIGKAAIMPFHRWLPSAMVAPTPVSALLHAVAVVKAGVFSVLKVSMYIFGIDLLGALPTTEFIMYLAGATIVIGSLIAMTKDNLKARLAYSTVSQLSYIILGAMLATSAGMIGGSMHILTHAFGKITLFFCAGAIMVASHKTEVSQLDGLGKAMPITMLAFLIGSISIIGLPPMGGTWSKWYLVMGTLEAGHQILLAVLMISTLLNIAYLLPIPIRAFYPSSKVDTSNIQYKEAPLACLIAIVITSLGCLVLFFYPEPAFDLIKKIEHL
ncbi:MAG: monovalent cation/H+ antiporter subunit D family protein [Pseudomonadales bacterium]|nr:monovalent cation/H+ antiporter subunit D family protein [Pseudomonadales bacterium]